MKLGRGRRRRVGRDEKTDGRKQRRGRKRGRKMRGGMKGGRGGEGLDGRERNWNRKGDEESYIKLGCCNLFL